jgi:hypothetical protein
MIGRITLEGNRVAEMGDDGVWSSTDQTLAQYLNDNFCPMSYRCPTCIPFGVLAVVAAAFELDAEVDGITPVK